MLRWIGWVMRLLLVGLGVLLLAWWPLSYAWLFYAGAPRPLDGFIAYSINGVFSVTIFTHAPIAPPPRLELVTEPWIDPGPSASLLPYFGSVNPVSGRGIAVNLPLWMLAALCLAWPAATLVLARRRHRRPGFEPEVRDQAT